MAVRLRTALSIALVLALGTVVLTATRARQPKPQPAVSLRAGYIPIAECVHLFVAASEKLFAGAGIDVQFQPLGGGAAALPRLEAGTLEVGFSNMVSVINYNAGLPPASPRRLVVLSIASHETAGHSNHALVVPASSQTTPAGLARGGKVALNTSDNIEELMLRRWARAKVAEGSTGRLRPIFMEFPVMYAALDTGTVDAASMVEPFITQAVGSGRYKVLARHYLDVSDDTLVATYVVRADWYGRNRELAARLRQTLDRANQFVLTRDADTRQIVSEFTKTPVADVRAMGMPAFESCPPARSIQSLIDAMAGVNFLVGVRGKRIPKAEEFLVGCPEDLDTVRR